MRTPISSAVPADLAERMSDRDDAAWQDEVEQETKRLAEELLQDQERMTDLIVTHDYLAKVLAVYIAHILPHVRDFNPQMHCEARLSCARIAGSALGVHAAILAIAETIVASEAEQIVNERWQS